jgi:hypothetical protein
MKLTRRFEMVSSCAIIVLGLNGFEVQRKIGILKSATIAKESFEVW